MQLADRSGVATSALRYYEELGLITSERTTGNQRRYPQPTLRRVAFVRSAQRVGLTLDEIAEALATLPEDPHPDQGRLVAALALVAPTASTPRSSGWSGCATGSTRCIGCGCLSLRTCALNNPDDEAADRGPGAVYLEPSSRSAPPRSSRSAASGS